MCDVVRERPDGEDEDNEDDEDELDPRVEIELEKLNKASIEINILEKELDEARAVFRQRLTDAAKHLKQLGKELGNNIDKARPYFEALSQSKKAQADCQDAAITYERACQLHKGARDTIAVAEEKMMNNPGMFDSAWQEMLNNANARILEAEKEKMIKEEIHREATMAYLELESRAAQLEKKLRKVVRKARPYFEQRAQSLGYLERQKTLVQELETSYAAAKKQYSDSLRNLEIISEEIHNKRNNKKISKKASAATKQHQEDVPVSTERGECVGAETTNQTITTTTTKPPPQSRRRSEVRRMSEEKIKKVLLRRRTAPSSSLGRYRHSLLLDLDVDFDLDDSDYSDDTPKSPGSKSVDMGCVNMKYYDDYQVLDILPFLEREKQSNAEEKWNTSRSSTIVSTTSMMDSADFENLSLSPTRSRSASEFEEITDKHLDYDTPEQLHRCHTAPKLIRRNTRPVIISMDDLLLEGRTTTNAGKLNVSPPIKSNDRKESKPVLITRFSVIEEGGENSIDALDNIPPSGSFTDNENEENFRLVEGVQKVVKDNKTELSEKASSEKSCNDKSQKDNKAGRTENTLSENPALTDRQQTSNDTKQINIDTEPSKNTEGALKDSENNSNEKTRETQASVVSGHELSDDNKPTLASVTETLNENGQPSVNGQTENC